MQNIKQYHNNAHTPIYVDMYICVCINVYKKHMCDNIHIYTYVIKVYKYVITERASHQKRLRCI